ncbi:MAG: transporter permease, partial [Rhizobacter sp.]|nr:transporter permease [Rhizobacter sp.]
MLGRLLVSWSWPELRHHPWRTATALLSVVLGVALAFAVQLINASALSEFSAAVRSVNGQPDFELRGQRSGFDEMLYARVAAHPQVALASPVIEVDTQAQAPDGTRQSLRVLGLDALVAAPLSPQLLPRPDAGVDRLAMLDPDAVFLNPAAQRLAQSAAAAASSPASAASADTPASSPQGANPEARLRLQIGTAWTSLDVRGSIAAAGTPLAVMDIAGAQERFGWLGRLSRIDVRLAPGADREQVLRDLALPAGVR